MTIVIDHPTHPWLIPLSLPHLCMIVVILTVVVPVRHPTIPDFLPVCDSIIFVAVLLPSLSFSFSTAGGWSEMSSKRFDDDDDNNDNEASTLDPMPLLSSLSSLSPS